jgi:TadE-like protein
MADALPSTLSSLLPRGVLRRAEGQAAAELVALLPVLLGLLACVWQGVLAGHASLAAATAARAAARAQAIGLDAPAAARAHLPRFLEQGLHVTPHSDGAVTVAVRIPTLPGVPDLGHARATARFEPQG